MPTVVTTTGWTSEPSSDEPPGVPPDWIRTAKAWLLQATDSVLGQAVGDFLSQSRAEAVRSKEAVPCSPAPRITNPRCRRHLAWRARDSAPSNAVVAQRAQMNAEAERKRPCLPGSPSFSAFQACTCGTFPPFLPSASAGTWGTFGTLEICPRIWHDRHPDNESCHQTWDA